MKKAKKYIAFLLLLSSFIFLEGCSSKERMFVSYLENKYGETFYYIEPTGGQIGGTSSEAWLKCDRFPGERILAARYKGADGKYRFYDNYMAFLLHDEAELTIKRILDEIFENYILHFPVPLVVLRDGTPEYGLEDYLKDPGADFYITIISYSDIDKKTINYLADAFKKQGIVSNIQIFFTGVNFDQKDITDSNIKRYILTDGWYQARVTFFFEEDGTIRNERWKYE